MDQDRILGPCKAARRRAARRRTARRTCCASSAPKNRANASSAARDGALDDPNSCDQTFPLPQRGDVFRLEDRCSICDQTPRLKVVPFRGRPWNLCLNDDCESMQEMKKRRAEREAARAAKEAMAKKPLPSKDGAEERDPSSKTGQSDERQMSVTLPSPRCVHNAEPKQGCPRIRSPRYRVGNQ